jgi:hypothetical protein
LALVEYNRQERERYEKAKAEREEKKKYPGLVRRLSIEELIERQKQEREA